MADISKKVEAIKEFITGLAEIRAAVKIDAKKMLAAIPVVVVGDETALTAYLEEMAQVIARKYLISADNKKIVPTTAKLINKYVEAMLKRS